MEHKTRNTHSEFLNLYKRNNTSTDHDQARIILLYANAQRRRIHIDRLTLKASNTQVDTEFIC